MSKLNTTLKIIFTRTPILYALLFFVSVGLTDQSKVVLGNSVRVLNHLMPSSYKVFFERQSPSKEVDESAWEPYIKYYEKVGEYLPDTADSFGLIGFCHYRSGQTNKAIEAYRQATDLNSHFFWAYYNLGTIYFNQGEYKKAVDTLTRAIQSKPEASLLFMRTSRLYQHIFRIQKTSDDDIKSGLDSGFLNSYKMIILAFQSIGNYKGMFQAASYILSQEKSDSGFFYFYAGLAKYHQKDYQQAVYLLQESIKRNPNVIEAFEMLGLSLRIFKEDTQANKALKQALLLKKSNKAVSYRTQNFDPKVF